VHRAGPRPERRQRRRSGRCLRHPGGEFVYCPWHQWGFELATGTTAVKPEWSIRTYPVQVVDHKVIITA